MPFPHRRLLLSSIAVIGLLSAFNVQAVTLIRDAKTTVQNPDGSTDIPVIVYFDNKLDVRSLRREVRTSIQGKNLSRKEMRHLQRTNTRRSMLQHLKANLLQPRRTLNKFLDNYGIHSNIKELWSVNALALAVPSELVELLPGLEGVVKVSLDYSFTLSATTTAVTSGIPLWNLEDINAPLLWDNDLTGEGVVVGIMDSGVDLNHPDLADKWRGGANSWFDPYGTHATPVDFIGHGTRVTGLVLGGDNSGYQVGVAPRAKWIAAKIFDDTGKANISKISEAFQWMLDPDGDELTDDAPDIINNSWVIEGLTNVCTQSLDDVELDILSQNLAVLREAGIAVVFSAGNFGPYAETSLPPANDPSIELSVGSINQGHEVEFTSSRGPGACDGGIYPKLVAPGADIFTTDILPNAYTIVSGTSFAAPMVAGAIAQLMSSPFKASLTQIESALRESAQDIDEFGADNNAGYGLIDVAAAYEWLLSTLDITDAGIILFSSQSYSVDENTSQLQVTLRRIGGSKGEISVDYQTYDGTAQGFANADYVSASGTLTFNDSETSRSFNITINDDTIDETNEDFTIELSNPTGGALLGSRISAPVVILDDDGPGQLMLESSSYAINENSDSIEVMVLRTEGYDGAVSVDYTTADVSANDVSDYLAATGTLTFEDGERSKSIKVEIVNDDEYEPNESFDIMLSNPLGGAGIAGTDQSTVTILNDDVNPLQTVLQLEASSYEFQENSGTVQITLRRLGDTSDKVAVDYSTTDGSAVEGADYEKSSGTAIFQAGQATQTIKIDVNILDDTEYEGTETFNLVLFNATNDAVLGNPTTTIVSIKDNDALPFVALSSSGSSLSSSGSTGSTSNTQTTNDGTADSANNKTTTSQTGSLTIHDLTLAGFSGLGSIYNDDLNPLLSIQPIASPGTDADHDGYWSGIDCNDQAADIHPGAMEIKHDGIDQDCNGYDLTIDIENPGYPAARPGKVEATSLLKRGADLSLAVDTQDGTRVTEQMRWNGRTKKWQSDIHNFINQLDTTPSSLTVSGPEGSETRSFR